VDLLSNVRNYHLPTEFPRNVVDEAEKIPQTVPAGMLEDREDLRKNFIITIDPDDARDFDDAINVEKLNSTGWELGVHIADVAAYVKPGSALDREARRRGNSVYLPDRVIPMLPESLSNGVCSLKPGVDRLTHSVFIQFDEKANVKKARFARTVIRSAHRLTYKQAYALLKSQPIDELGKRLHRAWELAALLRRQRFQHGSLDLDFPEVKVRLDDKGKPIQLERIENDESHQLIEEFMLAANELVARELKKRSIPTIYRVHENPDPEKLAEYREFILSHGYKVGDLTHRAEVQRFLNSIKGKPEEPALKVGLLKSLKRARYLPQPLGHYGLAKANYLHFTSPIRRYADLVAHRSIAGANQSRRSQPDMSELASISEQI
jgi:ribonuclease R